MIACHSLICGSLQERHILSHNIEMGHTDWGFYQMTYIGKSGCVWRYSFSVWVLSLSDHYSTVSINFHSVFHAAQNTVCPLGCQGSQLAHAEPVFSPAPQVPFCQGCYLATPPQVYACVQHYSVADSESGICFCWIAWQWYFPKAPVYVDPSARALVPQESQTRGIFLLCQEFSFYCSSRPHLNSKS